uniref:Uncharacterized protein n=1 Tax=Anguilla anguilla TaxID=7936 RepID=A0A0E9V1G0_ANGAN
MNLVMLEKQTLSFVHISPCRSPSLSREQRNESENNGDVNVCFFEQSVKSVHLEPSAQK